MNDEIYIKNTWWYLKTYDNLILKGKIRGLDKTKLSYYVEKHHIVPRCMGGADIDDNYVLLTYREHVIAHMLLSRIYDNNIELKHVVLFMLSSKKNDKIINFSSSKFLDNIRESGINYIRELRKRQVGQRYPDQRRKNISKGVTGLKVSKETREKQSITNGRRVKDPNGIIYSSLQKCALANNLTPRVLQYTLKNHPEKGFEYVDAPKIYKVLGPDGTIYNSIRQCAIKLNRDGKTIKNWIENYPEFGYKYYLD